MATNAQIVNSAAKKMRISGLTVSLEPEEQKDFFDVLVGMMREFDSRNITTNYNYDNTSINDESGIPPEFTESAAWCLALRMLSYFGRMPDAPMLAQANQSASNWAARTAKVSKIKPPSTQPIGSGNESKYLQNRRFYPIYEEAAQNGDN